jgi:hypothetical protein
LLVENASVYKKMSYSQVTSLFKANKDEKMIKMLKRTADVAVAVIADV